MVDDIQARLNTYIKKIYDLIKKSIADGSLQKSIVSERVFKYKQFIKKGPGRYLTSGHTENKPTERWNSIETIEKKIESTIEYEEMIQLLQRNEKVKPEDASRYVKGFNHILIVEYLKEMNINDEIIKNYSNSFIKSIRKEPLKYKIIVKLIGIDIASTPIQIADNIIIKSVEKDDLEGDVNPYYFGSMQTPSSILTIDFETASDYNLYIFMMKTIAIFRLFDIGSIQYIGYKEISNNAIDQSFRKKSMSMIDNKKAPFLYSIDKQNDISTFWNILNETIPRTFYDERQKTIDSRTIAYKRYCDSILIEGMPEKRISDAIMGLEALYLTGEKDELSYRLRMRIAKVLGMLDKNPEYYIKIIKEAYKIRSKFLHGGQMTAEDENRIITKYSSVDFFVKEIIDILRISIIVQILVIEKKEVFIQNIDSSFIDEKKTEELKQKICRFKGIVKCNSYKSQDSQVKNNGE